MPDSSAAASPTPLGRPVGASADDTRRRIIEATARCVAEVGYSGATIRQIAAIANMTSGSLYHYYPNKAELVAATSAELASAVLPRLSHAAHGAGSVVDRLMSVFDECERIHRDHPFAAAFDQAMRAANARNSADGDTETGLAVLHDVIVDLVEEGRAEGTLSPEIDVGAAANAVLTVIRGLNEFTTTAPPNSYHDTVLALKAMVRGSLFDDRIR